MSGDIGLNLLSTDLWAGMSSINFDVVALAEMHSWKLAICRAHVPVATRLLTVHGHLKRASHADEIYPERLKDFQTVGVRAHLPIA